MNEIPKSPMVIGSAIPLTPMTLAPSVGESAILAHIKRLSSKIDRLEKMIEELKELAGIHQNVLEELFSRTLKEHSNGRTN